MLYSLLFELSSVPFVYKVIIFLAFTFAVIFALTIHEFSHAFVALKCGDNTAKLQGRLTLNPMAHFDFIGLLCFLFLGFGWAKPVPVNPYNFKNIKRDSLFVSLAGIILNLLCVIIFCPFEMLLFNCVGSSIWLYALYCLCAYIYQTNLVFMVFNLLPIAPLDGFNAIASQLKYSNPYVNFMQRYGSIILLLTVVILSFTNLFQTLVYYVGYPITYLWGLII